jgi:putative transposase
MREILNGIFYNLRTGCPWRYLPKNLPKWHVVYDSFQRFQHMELWKQMNATLRAGAGGRRANSAERCHSR